MAVINPTKIAVAGSDNKIHVISLKENTWEITKTFTGVEFPTSTLLISDDCKYLFAGNHNSSI